MEEKTVYGVVFIGGNRRTRVTRAMTPPPFLATTREPTLGSPKPTEAPNLHTSSPRTSSRSRVAIIGEHQSPWRDLIHHRSSQTPKRKLRMHYHPYRRRTSPSFDENTTSQHKSKHRNKDKQNKLNPKKLGTENRRRKTVETFTPRRQEPKTAELKKLPRPGYKRLAATEL
ncbi:hypothetical protein Bca101_083586 [Brassica carinata]